MADQPGFFDVEERLRALLAGEDPLERLKAILDFDLFRPDLEAALYRANRNGGRRPPYTTVLMFRILVLQTLYGLSGHQTEYQIRDRPSFMRFVGSAASIPCCANMATWPWADRSSMPRRSRLAARD